MASELPALRPAGRVPMRRDVALPLVGAGPQLGAIVLGTIATLAVGLVASIAWAAVATLESAVVAPGFFNVEGRRKTIDHLDGGIVSAIAVKEGEVVAAGQVLLRLDDTQLRTLLETVDAQHNLALAQIARLEAEDAGADAVRFPDELLARADEPAVARTIAEQRATFRVNREALASQISLTRAAIEHHRHDIRGITAQLASAEEQRRLIAREVDAVEQLLSKGLERMPRLLALLRTQAELLGRAGEHQSRIAQARKAIADAELKVSDLETQYRRDVAAKLETLRRDLATYREQRVATRDKVARTTVRAPVGGIVVDLRLFTIGGVVKAGEKLMEIVPEREDLIIDARIALSDRDAVRRGQMARIRLTSLNRGTTPVVEGEVVYVSADKLTDERGESYYTLQARLGADALRTLGDLKVDPGMPAEVIVVTGERTALDYLVKPIADGLARGLKEE